VLALITDARIIGEINRSIIISIESSSRNINMEFIQSTLQPQLLLCGVESATYPASTVEADTQRRFTDLQQIVLPALCNMFPVVDFRSAIWDIEKHQQGRHCPESLTT